MKKTFVARLAQLLKDLKEIGLINNEDFFVGWGSYQAGGYPLFAPCKIDCFLRITNEYWPEIFEAFVEEFQEYELTTFVEIDPASALQAGEDRVRVFDYNIIVKEPA